MYFDFSKDTLRFGNFQGDAYMNTPEMLQTWVDQLHARCFSWRGFYSAEDAEKVRLMITSIDDSVHWRRRAFCWDGIRLFTGLKELTLTPWVRMRWWMNL